MKFKRCYDIALAGRPSSKVQVLPEPQVLHLPLRSRRFSFSRLCVEEGQKVLPGRVLAEDPDNYSVPLLAPREGTVRLDRVENHVTLEDIARVPEEEYHPDEDAVHAPKDMGSVGMKRYKLVALGAWQFFEEAHGGALPDPFGTPSAVIVSTLSLEPFKARGNVHIGKRLESFTRGLEQIQSLLEYQPIYLVLPDIESELADRVRELVRGYAWVNIVPVPLSYPADNVGVLARKLGLKHGDPSPVWAVGPAGVLAVDRALTLSRPSTVRLITLGGPGAEDPRHVKAVPGYPLDAMLGDRADSQSWRVLNGGALTGETLEAGQAGLDVECEGLTILAEHVEREFIGFMMPGLGKRSYSNCFLSVLRGVVPAEAGHRPERRAARLRLLPVLRGGLPGRPDAPPDPQVPLPGRPGRGRARRHRPVRRLRPVHLRLPLQDRTAHATAGGRREGPQRASPGGGQPMKWLLSLMEHMRPAFEEGGKLRPFKAVFEATENFFFATDHRTERSPHIRDPLDLKRYMFTVILGVLPATLAAVYFFGLRVLVMIAVSYAAGGAIEVLFAVVRKEEISEGFLVTGLLFPLIVPPGLPYWMLALGVAFGVLVGKELFGGTGRNLFNPALVGRCFLFLAYPSGMSSGWIAPGSGATGRLLQWSARLTRTP